MAEDSAFNPKVFKQFEHDAWAEVASTYHDSFARMTLPLVEPLLNALGARQGIRLLEVACGTGQLTATALERGARAVGLDFVAEMVAEAQKLYPAAEFREGDAEALPFDNNSFDAVACNVGILHFPHPEKAIGEAFCVLVPGGRFAFTAWCGPERSPLFALLLGSIQEHGDMSVPIPPGPPMFTYGEHEACRKVLAGVGFVEAEVSEVPVVGGFSEPAEVMEMVYKGTARSKGLMKLQSEEDTRKIEDAVAEKAKGYEKDGEIQIPAPAALAVARKP